MIGKIKNLIKNQKFESKTYWENRYQSGSNSGSGSYNHLAEFKAEFLNDFVGKNNINSVIEFGCGDGNQVKMANYPNYIGLDVSVTAIQMCKNLFANDRTKSFFLYDHRAFVDNHELFKADVSLSLDVLYHLIEKEVYENYLKQLFSCASKNVIIYSSNKHIPQKNSLSHELHRQFTEDVKKLIEGWELEEMVKNKYPSKEYADEEGSLADFYVFAKS